MRVLLLVLMVLGFISCKEIGDEQSQSETQDQSQSRFTERELECVNYLDSLVVSDVYDFYNYEDCLYEISESHNWDGSITLLCDTNRYNDDTWDWDYYFSIYIDEESEKVTSIYKTVNI